MANQVAYGFINLSDVFAKRVNDVGVDTVTTAINRTIDEHNRQMDALLSLFVTRTTKFKTRYRTPTAARLQPMDQSGRARPIRLAGQYDVAWPLQMGAAAWGGNFLAMEKLTVAEANEYTLALQTADARWMRDHILAALFTNVEWTYQDDDDEVGALTIMPLANADTVTYHIKRGFDAGATDDHFLGQAAGIADATNPYPTIKAELDEHPENGGVVIALIPTNLRADTEALATFVEPSDSNVRLGANTLELVGSLGVSVPGSVIGYETSGVWIVEWASLPDSRIIGVTSEGPRPIAMREDEVESLRGFREVARRNDHPWYERQYLRRAGFGAWNRVGAVVMEVGDASYDIPTGYQAPIP